MKCAAGHCRLVEGILAIKGRGGCQDNDITLDTLLKKQKYYEDERNHYLEISKKLKKYC